MADRGKPIAAGTRFGKLVVLGRAHSNIVEKVLLWCECDCGRVAQAEARALARGAKTSCGCRARQVVKNLVEKHTREAEIKLDFTIDGDEMPAFVADPVEDLMTLGEVCGGRAGVG